MSPQSTTVVVTLILAVPAVLVVDRRLRPGLRGLLEDVTGLPAATEFYLRAFGLVVLFVALAAALGTSHSSMKDDAHFMEYVWAVADGLKDIFQNLMIVLLVYVGLVTVLMASLRRKS